MNRMKEPHIELIASSISPFTFTADSRSIQLRFIDDEKITVIKEKIPTYSESSPNRFSLRLEKIKGATTFPIIDVYINHEKEAFNKNNIGSLALFGLETSSKHAHGVSGNGLEEWFDVGDALSSASKQDDWSVSEFTITLVPRRPLEESAELTIEKVQLYYIEVD